MFDWYTFSVALFAAIGTLLFGFDTGIATTTIAQQSWVEYMGHPSNGLTGAVVALYVSSGTSLAHLVVVPVSETKGV
jgi:hypothetical protein